MNELKPIEAGCLAVTINCRVKSNNGKFVTVGNFIGTVEGYKSDDRWEVDRVMTDTKGELNYHMRASQLFRIDDPDLKEESEEELVLIEGES